jgi:hypothetical protein
MTDELDLVSAFEGLSQDEAKDLADRLRSAVPNEYRNFRQEKRIEPAKIREPAQVQHMSKRNMSRGNNGRV